jgi:FAD-dependent oxidoreductase family protein
MEELESICAPIPYYWLKPVKIMPIKIDDSNEVKKFMSIWAIEGPVISDFQSNADIVENFQFNQIKATHLLQKLHSVLPGWENCFVARTSDRMGLRQTRALKGLYVLSVKDLRGNTIKEDVIGRGSGHDVSRHMVDVESGYDIPYRALIPEEIDRLLVGARSISCDPEEKGLLALNAHRGISAAIIVSQAAGVAAALCIKHNIQPRNVDIKELQGILRNQNVVLDPPK